MGLEGDFDLASGRWFSTQHSPQWLDERTLLMYDNGARRPDEGYNNQVVVYDVDIEAASRSCGSTGESPYYVPAAGDVDLLDGGMLVTDGAWWMRSEHRRRARAADAPGGRAGGRARHLRAC